MGNDVRANGTTGWIVFLNDGVMAWRSKKQQRVGRSSLKVELIAMHDLLDYLEWFANLAKHVNKSVDIHIYTDSNDLVKLLEAKNPKPTEKSILYDILEMQQVLGNVPSASLLDSWKTLKSLSRKVSISHIPGDVNPADALTKACDAQSLDVMLNILEKGVSYWQTLLQRRKEKGKGGSACVTQLSRPRIIENG
eukprot:GDKJ01028456.1.p1 GENE.GDKJ01028456.1~~GDKJ01028456.1.p1  ORF type:complete len:219 (+),score=19.19 GDKJ01028456.1:77-658(+)